MIIRKKNDTLFNTSHTVHTHTGSDGERSTRLGHGDLASSFPRQPPRFHPSHSSPFFFPFDPSSSSSSSPFPPLPNELFLPAYDGRRGGLSFGELWPALDCRRRRFLVVKAESWRPWLLARPGFVVGYVFFFFFWAFLVLDLVMVGEGICVFGRCGLDAVEDFLGPRLSFLMVIIWVVWI